MPMKNVCWKWTTSGRSARRNSAKWFVYCDFSRRVMKKKSKCPSSVKKKCWFSSSLMRLKGDPA